MVLATRLALVVTVCVALGFAWVYGGGRWRERVADRLLYGIPWGTLVVVGINVGFYLFVQGGLTDWSDPLVYPFVSWSYFYPVGLLTSGIAHAGPNHLLSNMTATLVLAPIAEYAWGHHPPGNWGPLGGDEGRLDAGYSGGLLDRPWVRAVVVFPLVLVAGGVVGSLFSLGPGIGFSGVVFAIAGFALVNRPLSSVVAIIGASAIGRLTSAFSQPIIRAGVSASPPSPPAWANIGFQVHMLGFLVGAFVGVWLLRRREENPGRERVFFAVAAFGLAQSLWLIVLPEGENTYVLYQGAGVIFVILLSMVLTVAAGARDEPIPPVLDEYEQVPSRRVLAFLWLLLVALFLAAGLAGAKQVDQPFLAVAGPVVVLSLVCAVPALVPLLPQIPSPMTRRQGGATILAMLVLLVASVGIPLGFLTVTDDTIEAENTLTTGDYTIAYVDNGTTGHSLAIDLYEDEELQSNVTGVVIVNEQRQIWAVAIPERSLAFRGNATVDVGGIGWQETVSANRTGWSVVGNDSAYVVDIAVDGKQTRAYTSDPVRAAARIDNHSVAVVPTTDGFDLRVLRNGTRVGTAPIPGPDESTTVGPLTFVTETDGGERHVVARNDGTEVRIASRG